MTSKNESKVQSLTTEYLYILSFSIIFYAGVLYSYSSSISDFRTRSTNKPYETFGDFYPFYISQHQDRTCRILHVLGTTIMFIAIMFDVDIFFSLMPSLLIGGGVHLITTSLSNGILEMMAMILTFLYSMHAISRSSNRGLLLLIITYGFAWVGHFFFENNRPATFVYPTYSLLGDVKLWCEIMARTQNL